jgi:hypothetical protein
MDRDQLAEHLRFASELGVAGVSRDPAWRARSEKGVGSLFQNVSSGTEAMKKTPDPFLVLSPADGLAAVRADIGDCTRCKLHGLGRTDCVWCGQPTPT